ncbi:MAG: hypothetical protein C7B45_13815 [Sulfobacillus acidophilus]|uniref:Peptidase S24/S26A/S26B/S26C domain-containing protein n=1 Tax=Sulfobacillus acidophilus TaxID=53633 RepID=A0A2T2WEP2_9FIRM|nr:MAG: hypothetical protein C7B45_13815 [Sulfobacillus acidophilus]
MRVIDRIANLILEDPLITANRLAHRLGYAEEKTVYYWLHKANFSGLTAFKKAVLHGQFLPQGTMAEEPGSLYGRLPITDEWTLDGQPIFRGDTFAVSGGSPAELIWRYSGPALPTILPQDLLVLARIDPNATSPWVVARTKTGVEVRMAITHSANFIAIHPITLQRDNQCRPLYQILQLIRHY